MSDMFGELQAEAPISQGMLEGSIKFCEKGFIYEGPGINGKVYSYYRYLERLDQLSQPFLGKIDVRMIFFSTLGERFDVRFSINEHFYHEMKSRKEKEV